MLPRLKTCQDGPECCDTSNCAAVRIAAWLICWQFVCYPFWPARPTAHTETPSATCAGPRVDHPDSAYFLIHHPVNSRRKLVCCSFSNLALKLCKQSPSHRLCKKFAASAASDCKRTGPTEETFSALLFISFISECISLISTSICSNFSRSFV